MSNDTLAEDSDITVALVRAGWRIVFEEKAVAWTEVPSSLYQLWKQRYRWCFGILQVMWKHKGSVLDRGRAGWYGRFFVAYLVGFQILLPLLAPVMDIFLVPLTVVVSGAPAVQDRSGCSWIPSGYGYRSSTHALRDSRRGRGRVPASGRAAVDGAAAAEPPDP